MPRLDLSRRQGSVRISLQKIDFLIDNQTSELGEHFHRCGVENLSLQIIDCVRQGEDEALSVLEGYWQNVLATFQANDGNINIRNEWRNYMGPQPIVF